MTAIDLRKKAELCLRLADGLSLNNPGRVQLMEQAKDFRERAKELEAQDAQQRQQAYPIVQVSIYDSVDNSIRLVELPGAPS